MEPKVALLDTREASPAYCHLLWSEAKSFPWKEFLLSHLSDLDQVWFDMERICANTQLGKVILFDYASLFLSVCIVFVLTGLLKLLINVFYLFL